MDYLSFKKLAEKYLVDNYGTVDVVTSYNQQIQEKLHIHMTNLMMKYCGSDAGEIKKTLVKCKEYEKRFYSEYRK